MKVINVFKKEQGQIFILFAVALVALIGVTGLVVDAGYQRISQQKMKMASDSASLAGALELPNTTRAREKALEFCAINGFSDGQNGVNITTQVDPYGNNPNWYKVSITKPTSFMFGGMFGLTNKNLATFSTAEYKTYAPLDITGSGTYGGSVNQMNFVLQVKGCDSGHSQGDPISVKKLDNNNANAEYDPNGYNFKLYVPSNYEALNSTSQVLVEVYDPDCYKTHNSVVDDGNEDISTVYTLYKPDSTPNDYSDDVVIGTGTVAKNSSLSEKWIQLTNSNSTSFLGKFQFNINDANYGGGNYRINVHSVSTGGYGSNGFSLRAGPPRTRTNIGGKCNINPNNNSQSEFYLTKPDGSQITRDTLQEYTGPAKWIHLKPKGNGNQNSFTLNGQSFSLENKETYDFISSDMNVHLYNDGGGMGHWWIDVDATYAQVSSSATVTIPFNPNNGTDIFAIGKLPVRLYKTGNVDIALGYIPASTAGKKIYIKKFDTDIGSTSLTYTCDTLGQQYAGVLAGNDMYKTDEITVPQNYTGGTWYAHYNAGSNDVSTWWMWYQGTTQGEAGFVGLVE
ncbi:MAG TPA: hypothetical protein DF296_07030 [Candidatus Margulisbacteria bacterium]|nr:MAG: hypothetical protein A2X43_13590 [Candidatus Margulisbacteria bacterium GWD2_39_127]OGI05339.1 MAG: hypothetical protein A2X42_05800 [Candidatus Margulisbacteria bacterium GWF2_38_17]OGI06036.1 MAG: hypothetical protein A2X41_06235 [Candidatus Margulisbacteria bacterium GWE2_39_32]HAR62560.1 hypothetical protein [Candidatus Margulisiibacteriota bacterium]HCT84939.1 hypothetical protein [Candidatus Margulisiibacteriota bacterium]